VSGARRLLDAAVPASHLFGAGVLICGSVEIGSAVQSGLDASGGSQRYRIFAGCISLKIVCAVNPRCIVAATAPSRFNHLADAQPRLAAGHRAEDDMDIICR